MKIFNTYCNSVARLRKRRDNKLNELDLNRKKDKRETDKEVLRLTGAVHGAGVLCFFLLPSQGWKVLLLNGLQQNVRKLPTKRRKEEEKARQKTHTHNENRNKTQVGGEDKVRKAIQMVLVTYV